MGASSYCSCPPWQLGTNIACSAKTLHTRVGLFEGLTVRELYDALQLQRPADFVAESSITHPLPAILTKRIPCCCS